MASVVYLYQQQCPRMLLELINSVSTTPTVNKKYVRKQKWNQLQVLRVRSVGRRISTRVDEGKNSQSLVAIKMKARTAVARREEESRPCVPRI